MKNSKSVNNTEKRSKARIPYSGHIFFATKDRFYEGKLKNYSNRGLFIQTEALLYVGDVITIALPYEQGKNTKIKGQIVRCDRKGYGIELFKKRSAENDKVLNKF